VLLAGLAAETLLTVFVLIGDGRIADRQSRAIAEARREIRDQQPRVLRQLVMGASQTRVELPDDSSVTLVPPTATCTDGKMNGSETDADCDGPCAACASNGPV
jgi:rRNA maturation endonuclease Nob1